MDKEQPSENMDTLLKTPSISTKEAVDLEGRYGDIKFNYFNLDYPDGQNERLVLIGLSPI
jgi:hypothetical protein